PSLGFAPGPALPLESLLPCLAERFVVADVAAGVAAIGGRVVVALDVAGRPTRDDRQPDAVRPQPPASDTNRILRHRGTSPVCSLPGRRRTGPGPTPPLAPQRADGTAQRSTRPRVVSASPAATTRQTAAPRAASQRPGRRPVRLCTSTRRAPGTRPSPPTGTPARGWRASRRSGTATPTSPGPNRAPARPARRARGSGPGRRRARAASRSGPTPPEPRRRPARVEGRGGSLP